MPPTKQQEIWREVNSQAVIHNARDGWIRTRREKTEASSFKRAVAAYWCSLFPKFRDELSLRIGDGVRNEDGFDDLWNEVFPSARGESSKDRERYTSDKIAQAIDRVLEDNHFFYTYLDYEYREMKKHKDENEPGGGQDELE